MNFFSFSEKDDTARLTLRGPVCTERPIDIYNQNKEAITPHELDTALQACEGKKKITVEINSQGGEIFSGIAICNRLKNLPIETEAIVMGVAASAASVILCGCKTRKACKGAQILIHEAHTVLEKNQNIDAAAARKTADTLEAINDSMAEIYSAATGRDKNECRELMANESWISADRALELGFISEILDNPANLSGEIRADIPLIINTNTIMGNTTKTDKQDNGNKAMPPADKADENKDKELVDAKDLQQKLDIANKTIAKQKEEIEELRSECSRNKKQQAELAVKAAISAGKIAPKDKQTISALTENYLTNPEGTQQIINGMAVLPGYGSAISASKPELSQNTLATPFDTILAANQAEIDARTTN